MRALRLPLVRFGTLATLCLGIGSDGLFAAPLTIVNPGFEDISGETPSNEFTFGPLNGWDLYDPDEIADGGAGSTYFIGTLRPTEQDPDGNPGVYENYPDGAPQGIRVGIAFNFEGSGGGGEYGFQQTLDDNLQANTTYTLSVLIGNIASGTAVDDTYYNLDGFPGYRVDLMAGSVEDSTVLASDNNSLAGSIPNGQFAPTTVVFQTGANHPRLGEPLRIRLVNLNLVDPEYPESDLEVNFDAISLTAVPIPEPAPAAAILFLLLAACVLLPIKRGSYGPAS